MVRATATNQLDRPGFWSGVWRGLTRPRGDRRWDWLLRSTAAAALVGIPLVRYVPSSVPLVWLTVLGLPACGPLGPILPTAFEPLIMEAAKYHSPLVVTSLSVVIYVYMEYLNFHLYRWVLHRRNMAVVRNTDWVRRWVAAFGRRPFWTTVFFAVTPLPFWVARILAILDGYDLRRFLVGTAIGRFPRLFLYAWLGEMLKLPSWVYVLVALGGGVALVAWRIARGKPIFVDAVEEATQDAEAPAGDDDAERRISP